MPLRFGLPEAAIAGMQAVFARHPEVERVVLYGSRAKGCQRPGSDIDLTLFGPTLQHQHLLTLIGELDDLLLPWMIDLSLYQQISDPAVREHIARIGLPFYP
ncbi:MAG: hypothetical protein RIR00_2024 [Pseudomonadota bacterium]|jgi:predicted nucleotidyltransferase